VGIDEANHRRPECVVVACTHCALHIDAEHEYASILLPAGRMTSADGG
jgi:hypothetical protein